MKQVLITGGSKGIGEALVKVFHDHSYTVISLDKEKPERPINGVIYETIDIRDKEAVLNYSKRVNKVHVLINNAAAQSIEAFKKLTDEQIKEMLDVNIMGTLNVTRAFLNNMEEDGLIINVGSVHSNVPRKNKIPYDMSKAALNIFTKELALELEEDKIRTLCVELGAVKTPMNYNFENKDDLEAAINKQVINHLLTSEECANAIYSLTKEEFKYMNGAVVTIDCGRSLK